MINIAFKPGCFVLMGQMIFMYSYIHLIILGTTCNILKWISLVILWVAGFGLWRRMDRRWRRGTRREGGGLVKEGQKEGKWLSYHFYRPQGPQSQLLWLRISRTFSAAKLGSHWMSSSINVEHSDFRLEKKEENGKTCGTSNVNKEN